MAKYIIVIFSLILLTACSKSENSEEFSSVSSRSAPAETSLSSTATTNSKPAQANESSENVEQNFPYAVNLDDFIQEIAPNEDETNKKILYHLTFITNKNNVPNTITLNIKDLNDFEKGIYISSNEADVFYPISINETTTKNILLVEDNGNKRQIKTNTEVKVEMPKNQQDSLQIAGDIYYLFYNQQGTISLATRDFNKNPGPEDLDNNMIEYIQQSEAQSTEQTTESGATKESDQYYNSIKEAWDNQKNYVDSIEDPKVKQSTQTPFSAANAEASKLEQDNPEDAKIIRESLQKVLDGQ